MCFVLEWSEFSGCREWRRVFCLAKFLGRFAKGESVMKRMILIVLLILMAGGSLGFAIVPHGWEKVSGDPVNYHGVPDGINGNRENSYAWCMEVCGDYLYVGTVQNVIGLMLYGIGIMPQDPESPVPDITELRGSIFRMNLETEVWELVYICSDKSNGFGPVRFGLDNGYRIMKCFQADGKDEILYAGSAGLVVNKEYASCSLLAIEPDRIGEEGYVPQSVFAMMQNRNISIRSIIEHDGMLYWATADVNNMGDEDPTNDVFEGPAIWYSADPLGDYQSGVNLHENKIDIPDWFPVYGAEVMDMISYNNSIYVFFLTYNEMEGGFWCAKLRNKGTNEVPEWKWELIVGNEMMVDGKTYTPKYPPGMGDFRNSGISCIVYKDKVYVGTLCGLAFRFMYQADEAADGAVDIEMLKELGGRQIFRFDEEDEWERVVPDPRIQNEYLSLAVSGWMNPLNLYMWRFGIYDEKLYVGTFDATTAIKAVGGMLAEDVVEDPMGSLIADLLVICPEGFDLYYTFDGDVWLPASRDGFCDSWNYGVRSFASDPATGDLYLGTANPFFGCQVWKKKGGLKVCGGADINGDGRVDCSDLSMIMQYWLDECDYCE